MIALLGIIFIILIAPFLGIVLGAFGGWMVGLLFPETLALISTGIFDTPVPVWQLGAALGFFGAFFRNTSSSSS